MTKTNDDFEIVRGSGNVFRDFDRPDADVQQTKAILAAKIIGILDEAELSTRQAQEKTGVTILSLSASAMPSFPVLRSID